jgi:hypothetical protein
VHLELAWQIPFILFSGCRYDKIQARIVPGPVGSGQSRNCTLSKPAGKGQMLTAGIFSERLENDTNGNFARYWHALFFSRAASMPVKI